MTEFPKYSFIEFLAASEADDFFDIDSDSLDFAWKMVKGVMSDYVSKEERDYWNGVGWLEHELQMYQLYLDDPIRYIKEDWECNTIEEFKKCFNE